jgi:hypothetical protein
MDFAATASFYGALKATPSTTNLATDMRPQGGANQIPIAGSQDMRSLGTHKRRARLLRSAKAVQWVGALWIVGCVGVALLALLGDQRFSDGVADATPIAVLGAIGFSVASVIAWFIKERA